MSIEEEEELTGREDSDDLSLGEPEPLVVPIGAQLEETLEPGNVVAIPYKHVPPRAVTIEQVEQAATMTDRVLLDVRIRRHVQDDAEGSFRDYPDGTARPLDASMLVTAKQQLVDAKKEVRLTWRHQLDLAVAELCAERDPKKLRRLLVNVAAVSVAWVEGLEVREADKRIAQQQGARRLVLMPDGGRRLVHVAPWWRRLLRWARLLD